MAEKTALLPVPGMTPAMAASAPTADPFASFPDALAAISPTHLLPPFSATPAGRGEAPPPPEPPETGAATPAEDPFAGFPDATPGAADSFDAYPDAQGLRGYDLTKLKATKTEDLIKDKAEFNPVEFYAKHEKELLNDSAALKQVEDAYEAREKEKLTAGQFVKGIVTAPLHPIETLKTVGKAIKGGAGVVKELALGAGEVARTSGQAAGALSAGDTKEAAGRLSDLVAGLDSASQKWVTTITSKLAPRPTDIRERLAYDAEFRKKELAAAAGNGEFARALGTDQQSLKEAGVTLDPQAIEKLSHIEDPFFLVPVGGAVGAVSRTGKFLIARTAGEATAEAFAKLGNAVLERYVGGTVEGLAKGAGKVLEGAGKAAEVAGEAGVKGVGALHLGLLKAAPKLAAITGKGVQAVGRGIQAAAPVAGVVGGEALKGAGEAGLLSVPLFIGSTPEERESLLGMVGAGGLLRGGGAAVGVGAEFGARKAQDALAKKIFEAADRGPVVDSPYYGTDPALDRAHAEQDTKLTPRQKSVLNWTREFFRNAGIEIYSLDTKTFTNHVPKVAGAEAAEGYFMTRGERVNPDGSRQPVLQILLNSDTNGLGHELYHAFKSLDPQGAAALEAHIDKTWHPVEKQWISDTYNSALNGGKPRSQWETRYDDRQILEEAAAEVFGRVFDATPLDGVQPTVTRRAAEFASNVLDKMGYPLAAKGLGARSGPGVSALGIRPGGKEIRVARDFLTNLSERVKGGEIHPAKPAKQTAISGPLTADIVLPKGPTPKGAPTVADVVPAAPTPKPATPAEAPAVPATPKTDVAAERSRVTRADEALKAAEASGDAQAVENVKAINASMENGHGVQITHKGVTREGGGAPREAGRSTRRAEQEAAYIKEAMGGVPEEIRTPYQKVLFGTRWQGTAKSGQSLTGRSVDKVLANVKNSVDMMSAAGETVPYETGPDGKLTVAGWNEALADLKDYWANQDRGYRGDGEKFVRPEKDIGVSIPPEDPRGPVATISRERTDFLNLVQGLNIPEAVTRQTKGVVPGNVKAQILAKAQGRTPQRPAAIKPEDVTRQTYKEIPGLGVFQIGEVNALRNRLRAAGQPVGQLIEVTENVNLKDIDSVTPRPEVEGRGGSTDITRSGFSTTAGKRPESFSVKAPEPSQEVRNIAAIAAKASGVKDYKPSANYGRLSPDLMKKLADFYEGATSAPEDPAVKASYDALIKQTEAQGKAILDAGYKIEPFQGEGEPYKSSADMVADVRDNKHLYFLQTEKQFGRGADKPVDNPMLRESTLVPGQVANDVFRWVHDFFGHAKEGYQFGPRGEFNAWRSHSEMFTPEAQGALAAETLAQNSWVNFGKHLRDANGNLPSAGEPGFVKPADRPFGEQKNVIVPDELIREARAQADSTAEPKLADGRFSAAETVPAEKDPIVAAAIRTKNGHVTTGSWHGDAVDRFAQEVAEGKVPNEEMPPGVKEASDLYDVGYLTDGYVTKSGKFLTREEALTHAQDIGQMPKNASGPFAREGLLESDEFKGQRSFSARARDAVEKLPPVKPGHVRLFHGEGGPEGGGTGGAFYAASPEKASTFGPQLSWVDVTVAEAKRAFDRAKKSNFGGGDNFILESDELRRSQRLEEQVEPPTFDLTPEDVRAQEPAAAAAFSVKRKTPKRETEAEANARVAATDYSKYDVPESAKPTGKQQATGWILPDRKFVPLDSAYHENFLAENSKQLNKQFGTGFSDTPDVESRLDALNNGFVRVRYEPNGTMHVQASAQTWPKAKKSILDHLFDNEDQIDRLHLSALNKKGIEVDSVSERLLDLDPAEKLDKIQEAVDSLRTGGKFSAKGPSAELPGFETPKKAEKGTPESYVADKAASVRRSFPEAVVPTYSRNKAGELNLDPKTGKPIPSKLDYELLDSPLAKQAAKGVKGDEARTEAISDAYAKKLGDLYDKIKSNPAITAGAKWYSTARARIKKLFGDDSKLFCELLGATSARTDVDVNYRTSLDAYNNFKAGAYDEQIKKYREGKAAWEKGDVQDFIQETGNTEPSRSQFLDWWIDKYDLKPRKSNGTLFAANSKQVLRVIDGSWLEEVQGPKTPNFTGNLLGTTFEATIDVWAARTMHRLGNEGLTAKRWRLTPVSETGVSDPDFYMAQKAFRKAADKIGIKPDALQAIIWFAEKDLWYKRGWAKEDDKADFNAHLSETEMLPSGVVRKKEPQATLELGETDVRRKKKS